MKTVLITGGAGFIGSNFIRYFLNKYPDVNVVNLDKLTYAGNLKNLGDVEGKKNYRFERGDICDQGRVEELVNGCDAIIHFAAESHVDNAIKGSAVFIQTNYVGTHILLEAARKSNIEKFLYISTDEVYGSIKKGEFKETDILKPSSPYSASKAGGDLLVSSYNATYALPTLITRSSNNFGPYQHPEKLIPLFITNLLEGKKVPLYGDGKNIRDWLYVVDNCEAIDFIFQNGKIGEIYNLGGSNEKENIEITKLILSELRKDEGFIQHVEDRKGHDRRYAVDCTKLKELGWKPRFDFESAIKETIGWYKDNRGWWEKLKKQHIP